MIDRLIYEIEESVRILSTKLYEPLVCYLFRQFCIKQQAVFIYLLDAEKIFLFRFLVGQWMVDNALGRTLQTIIIGIVLQVLYVVGGCSPPGPLVV